jgi:repressor LexA
MPEPLTDRQREVLNVVCEAIQQNGVPPSLNEIRDALGINSLRGVTDHLDVLERKGWLRRAGSKGSARNWQVIGMEDSRPDPVAQAIALPLYGEIAAGIPIDGQRQVEDHIPVPPELVGNGGECFIFRVKGDSMIGDAICDGDLAVLQSLTTARSGDIVAVMVDGEATLKHYVKIGSRIELHSSNPIYDPIPVTHENSQIVGKLVGLMRRYC